MEEKRRRRIVRNSSKGTANEKFSKTIKSEITTYNRKIYGSVPKKSTLVVERLKRDLRRTRNSASYRIGNAIINSILKPWRLLLLPFNIIKISWTLANERLGIKNK